MFSTRRRRRALVLVGIGCVGVPRRAARPRRPRVDAFNGSTFFPSSTGHPRGASPRHRRACQFQRAFPGCSRVSSLHCTTRRTRSAGAALAYGARLAYLASLEEDEAGCRAGNGRRRGDPGGGRDGRGGAEFPVAVTLETVAGIKNTTRHAGESRSRRRGARDERTTSVLRRAIGFPNGGPPRDDVTGTAASPHHSPPPFGAAYASSPLPSRRATAKRDANGEDARRGASAPPPPRRPSATARDDAAKLYASPGSASRDGTRTEGERYSESDKHSSLGTTPCRPTSSARRAGSRWPRWTRRNGGSTSRTLPAWASGLCRTRSSACRRTARGWWCCPWWTRPRWPPRARRAREMVKLLPSLCGAACFTVPRNAYHVSVFFLSLPTDPVADPLSARADADAGKLADARFPNKNETNSLSTSRSPRRRFGASAACAARARRRGARGQTRRAQPTRFLKRRRFSKNAARRQQRWTASRW